MSARSDVMYGRRGGRLAGAATIRRTAPEISMPQTATQMRDHLIVEHAIPSQTVDQHTPEEWAIWHTSEHRRRHPERSGPNAGPLHPGHLHHEHPPKAMREMRAR